MRYNPNTSLLAGLDTSYLQAQLTAMQQAYLQLAGGASVAVASYTQGDGAKSVTYRQADMAAMQMTIRTLQSQLGLVPHGRRAFGVRF